MLFRVISVLILSIVSLNAQNCVPEALHAFAQAKNLPSDKATWFKACEPGKDGTGMAEWLEAWKKNETVPLIVVYSADVCWQEENKEPLPYQLKSLQEKLTKVQQDYKHGIVLNSPYLWVGIRQGGLHMSLVYYSETTTRLVHPNTIDPDTKKPFEEIVPYEELMRTSLAVFRI